MCVLNSWANVCPQFLAHVCLKFLGLRYKRLVSIGRCLLNTNFYILKSKETVNVGSKFETVHLRIWELSFIDAGLKIA